TERLRDQLDRPVDVVVADVHVDGDAQDARPQPADADAVLGDAGLRVGDVDADRGDVDADEVRVGGADVHGQPGVGETLGEPPGPGVVLREPLDVVVERVEHR